ncbi:TlyA family RNA methyltransferase [Caulobacter henricii]|uniref:Hemolysin n=1 Tax=Caulobacter henricii TaxID=69395 RepID=A0A0P0NZH6_9CAUL|nr:TlyA family RNA methyltransferase [Caulobacter henricii]ALL13551.1 hemolysin [Caulobacter henricii]
MTRRRVDVLMMERGLFDSRAKAREAIEAGLVQADGVLVRKPSEMVEEHVSIRASAAHPWVGRGALKLVHALDLWPIVVEGKVAIDVGASTGGFTEVLLSRGAAKVYAVDVGRDQLHHSLVEHERVVDLSGTDARLLDSSWIAEDPELIVSDVSFISMTKALPAALDLAVPGTDLIALIKPQFEAGREHVGKGGLVKDPETIDRVHREIISFLEVSGWTVMGQAESPITGGDGQVEGLIWARRQ